MALIVIGQSVPFFMLKRRNKDGKSKKIKKMIWTHGWVVFPVITGRPLHYYWKGNKFQTEVVKKIIALDANHIVVEGEEKTYYIQFFVDEAESLKAAA